MYRLRISEEADHDLSRLKKHEPKAFKKALQLLEELAEHPQTGTGHPELLKGDRPGQWSRRINKKRRRVTLRPNLSAKPASTPETRRCRFNL